MLCYKIYSINIDTEIDIEIDIEISIEIGGSICGLRFYYLV